MAEGDECDSWRSRMLWPKETNAIAEGVECCDRRRRIRWPKESNAMVEGDKSGGWRSLKQATTSGTSIERIVYLLIPTSNHNYCDKEQVWWTLYIFWFLHQTTTNWILSVCSRRLYIFWFLHQTTTSRKDLVNLTCCISFDSYIKPQHVERQIKDRDCCISFDSYIKPQLCIDEAE